MLFLQLTWFKVKANLSSEVKRYYLNYLWWVIEPVLSMLVFYIVFGVLLSRGGQNFVQFLLIGIVFWQWLQKSISHCSLSIYNAKGIIQQLKIDKYFFPLVTVLQDTIKTLIVIVLLVVFLWLSGFPPTVYWFSLVPLILTQFILVAACSFWAAALVPFFPDLRFLIDTGLHLLFFGSGIFYDIEKIVLPEHRLIVYLNPMAGILKGYRTVFLDHAWPDFTYLLYVALFSVILLLSAILFFRKFDQTYPRVVI